MKKIYSHKIFLLSLLLYFTTAYSEIYKSVDEDGNIIFTGKIASIFREKNQVKQVGNGQECGITLKDYMDFQKNDTIEAFNVTSTERSI